MSGLFRFALRAVRNHSGTRLGQAIQRASYAVYRASNNPGYNFADNGELNVLREFGALPGEPIVMDVGANNGHWSTECVRVLGNRATVHAFEPGRRVFEKLKKTAEGAANIHAYQLGLSSANVEMNIMVSDSVPEKSSVEIQSAKSVSPHLSDYHEETQKFVTGDWFCEEHGLERIDFLKVDTEGHDYQVLIGLEKMISTGRVDVIQFEYNRLNIYTKSLLQDFDTFLNTTCCESGYMIGRIYPNGVLFKQYSVYDENFIDGNFLAVRTELSNLITRLAL